MYYIIQENSYVKPYKDDTGVTVVNSSSNLTASINDLMEEIGFEIPLERAELLIPERMIEISEESDYRPLLDSDPTDEF